MSRHAGPDTGLALDVEEADAVATAARAYAAALPADRATAYQDLAEAAASGHVPDHLVGALEQVTTVSLQTGQARRSGRAEAERLLTAVYRRTLAGKALATSVEEVNQALTALAGRTLQTARAAAPAPGRYSLTLAAGGVTVTLSVDAAGIGVRSLQAG